MNILSIDAWRDGDGWTWNQWFRIGTISSEDFVRVSKTNRSLLKWARDVGGFLGDGSRGRVYVEDDGFNLVIRARSNHEPLFAFEYGCKGEG